MSIKSPILIVCSLALGLAVTTGCLRDQCDRTHTFIQYDPVYKGLDELRTDVKMSEARDLVNPGNINYYNGYLLINERQEGIHVIDNSDPSNPVNLGFMEIPGNLDMAVRNGLLYADMYMDLVTIDISDPLNATLVERTEDVFQAYYPFFETLGYVVEYVPTDRTIEVDCNDGRFGSPWFRQEDVLFWNTSFDATVNQSGGNGAIAGGIGIGGSMARFTIAKDHLYALDEWRMQVFDIGQQEPSHENTVDMSWGIETLFPYGDYLFVGANEGMFIYDNSNPSLPTYLSQFSHARACDPVFVTDDVAYVTLRDGNTCNTFNNQLDVIDVSNISNPTLIRSYPMQHPHGLSIVDETLYLCEGQFGLKLFSTTDLNDIAKNALGKVDINSFDVIVLPPGNLVMVIGTDGLYQYDATDREELVELSRIEIIRG